MATGPERMASRIGERHRENGRDGNGARTPGAQTRNAANGDRDRDCKEHNPNEVNVKSGQRVVCICMHGLARVTHTNQQNAGRRNPKNHRCP
eukprot:6877095-Lingulodinium_polyedra.AAC.1